MRSRFFFFAILVVLALTVVSCAPSPTPPPPTAAPPATQPPAATAAPKATQPPAPTAAPAKTYKLAALFPGTVTDADYNTLGYLAAQAVQGELGVKIAFSENVAVPDVERVMREYLDQGFNIVWTHGSQFITQSKNIAKQFPNAVIIAETDGPEADAPANLWIIDRNFHIGFYAVGYTAAKSTKANKIGYLGGLTLPFSYAEYHAIEQSLKDAGSKATFKGVWVGDFNDPTKARQTADALIADGNDVILGSLNLGMFGLFEAVKAKPEPKVFVTAKYTDKSSYAPNNVVTSLLYDFAGPLKEIVKQVQGGKTGGYYPLGFATGVNLQFPLKNVPADVNTELQRVVGDLKADKIKVVKDTTAVK